MLTLARLDVQSATYIAPHHPLHRLFELCRRNDARVTLFGHDVVAHFRHLLVLRCIGAHLALATVHNHVSLPPVPWKEA